jgi:hypothetical protein
VAFIPLTCSSIHCSELDLSNGGSRLRGQRSLRHEHIVGTGKNSVAILKDGPVC